MYSDDDNLIEDESYYDEHEDLTYGWDDKDFELEEELYDRLTADEVVECVEAVEELDY